MQCWYIVSHAEIRICNGSNQSTIDREYNVHNLLPNTTYYFQVQAYTEVGAGPYTDTIEISTAYEDPLPQLLAATSDSVRIADLDQAVNKTLTRHITTEIAYLGAKNKMYWINEMQELVTSSLSGANVTKILALNNTASSLCINWISRHLFWAETGYRESSMSHIVKFDLTAWEAGIVKHKIIATRGQRIVNLEISPSTE